jgi:uncharacterized SAM-binding protein YcdF (DUF218 family)
MRRPLLLLALLASVVLAVASVFLFILYDDDRVAQADAVIVLAGAKRRLPAGQDLVARGVAPVLVISDGLDSGWTRANRLCRFGDPKRVLCPRPDPYSTRGEAQMVARLARLHGWDSLVVVTSRFHLFRSRLLFERCFHGRLAFVGVRSPRLRLPVSIGWEWLKLANATVRRGC